MEVTKDHKKKNVKKENEGTFEDSTETKSDIKPENLPKANEVITPNERIEVAISKGIEDRSDKTNVLFDEITLALPTNVATQLLETPVQSAIPKNTWVPKIVDHYSSVFKFGIWAGKPLESLNLTAYDLSKFSSFQHPGDKTYETADNIFFIHRSRSSVGDYQFVKLFPLPVNLERENTTNSKCFSVSKSTFMTDYYSIIFDFAFNKNVLVMNRQTTGTANLGKIDNEHSDNLGWLWNHNPMVNNHFWRHMFQDLDQIRTEIGEYQSVRLINGQVKSMEEHWTPITPIEALYYEVYRVMKHDHLTIPAADLLTYYQLFNDIDEKVVYQNWRDEFNRAPILQPEYGTSYKLLLALSRTFRSLIHEPYIASAMDNFYNHLEITEQDINSQLSVTYTENLTQKNLAKATLKKIITQSSSLIFKSLMNWYFLSSYTYVKIQLPMRSIGQEFTFLGAVMLKNIYIPAALQYRLQGWELFHWFIYNYFIPMHEAGRRAGGLAIADIMNPFNDGAGIYIGGRPWHTMRFEDLPLEGHLPVRGPATEAIIQFLRPLLDVCFGYPYTENHIHAHGVGSRLSGCADDVEVQYQTINSCVDRLYSEPQINELQRVKRFNAWYLQNILPNIGLNQYDRNSVAIYYEMFNKVTPHRIYEQMYGMNILVKQMGINPLNTINLCTNINDSDTCLDWIDDGVWVDIDLDEHPNHSSRINLAVDDGAYKDYEIKYVNPTMGITFAERLQFKDKIIGATKDNIRKWGIEIIDDIGFSMSVIMKLYFSMNPRSAAIGPNLEVDEVVVAANMGNSIFATDHNIANGTFSQLTLDTGSSQWERCLNDMSSYTCKVVDKAKLAKVLSSDGIGIRKLARATISFVNGETDAAVHNWTDLDTIPLYIHNALQYSVTVFDNFKPLLLQTNRVVIFPREITFRMTSDWSRTGVAATPDFMAELLGEKDKSIKLAAVATLYLMSLEAIGYYEANDIMVNRDMDDVFSAPFTFDITQFDGDVAVDLLAPYIDDPDVIRGYIDELRDQLEVGYVAMQVEVFMRLPDYVRRNFMETLSNTGSYLLLTGLIPFKYYMLEDGVEYREEARSDIAFCPNGHYPIFEVPFFPTKYGEHHRLKPKVVKRSLIASRLISIGANLCNAFDDEDLRRPYRVGDLDIGYNGEYGTAHEARGDIVIGQIGPMAQAHTYEDIYDFNTDIPIVIDASVTRV